MEKHVNLLGVLWVVMGALYLIFGFFAFMIIFGASFIPDMGDIAPNVLRIVALVATIFFGVLGIPKIIGGIALIKRLEWGRILVLILSFLSLINIPLGTALAIYSFIILLKDETIKLFMKKT